LNNEEGIPKVNWFEKKNGCNLLSMELLGPSLKDFFYYCNKNFSLKTSIMLAIQILQRIEYIHSRFYIHRDIKPENFVMGIGSKANKVYCIDFGLSKQYRNTKNGDHIQYKDCKYMVGTPVYASINTHLGVEQSRRDDLESLGYTMVYFLRKELPWQNLNAKTKKEKIKKIMEKKISIPLEELCKDLPSNFNKLTFR